MKRKSPAEYSSQRSAAYQFPSESRLVREYDIAALDDSRDNYFRRMEGEQWDAFVNSIRAYGVVSPLLIRPRSGFPGRYEILAGHNRRSGAAEAGLKTVPCISLEVDDVDASVLIGISNQQREEVSDLEWGWTYRTTLEMIKGRNSASRRKTGERSIDAVARKYGVNRKTVHRKIRLTHLVPQLYDLGQRMGYTQKMLVALSYLPAEIQTNVAQAVVIENCTLTDTVVARLRSKAASGDLSINEVLRICRAGNNERDPDGRTGATDVPGPPSAKYEIADLLFPSDLPKGRRQHYVTAALEYIMAKGISLENL